MTPASAATMNASLPPLTADSLLLAAHVRACELARGPAFAWRCLVERVHALVGPRLVTTAMVAAALMALLSGCT